MANTKNINFKGYSKRVPRSVLRGGNAIQTTSPGIKNDARVPTRAKAAKKPPDDNLYDDFDFQGTNTKARKRAEEKAKVEAEEKTAREAAEAAREAAAREAAAREVDRLRVQSDEEKILKKIAKFDNDESKLQTTTNINQEYNDWININKTNNNFGSISIKLNDTLKVPYPSFLEKYVEYNNMPQLDEKLVEQQTMTNALIDNNSFELIKDHIVNKLKNYYNVVDKNGGGSGGDATKQGGAVSGDGITTPHEFIILMAKWFFIIWGYKTLNRNFCNKYLENKIPSSSSYTKSQLSLDHRRKITGITCIYKEADRVVKKHQFVIKASLNRDYIPEYIKEIENYKTLWKQHDRKNTKIDNKFNVLRYFGSSSESNVSMNFSTGDQAQERWTGDTSVTSNTSKDWAYTKITNVLTIQSTLDGKEYGEVSTNLDLHANAIEHAGERNIFNPERANARSKVNPTGVCWFAVEWDPDFIPFSTSHFEGRRDFKLDQTVLRKMTENIYHLSNEYGFYHGDLHTENFLYNIKGDIKRFDFDFSGVISEDDNTESVNNKQINVYFGQQPSKISMYLFMNLYKTTTDTLRPWTKEGGDNIRWNPMASDELSYPKIQHKEFLKLFDMHRMLLHYFLSIKGPVNTSPKEIKDTIDIIFKNNNINTTNNNTTTTHMKILVDSVTNNMFAFWNGSDTKKKLEEKLDSDMFYENTWNAGCMYSLLWYFGKYKSTRSENTYMKWYNYDNHLKFFEFHLKDLIYRSYD